MENSMFVVCGEALMDVFPAGETATGVALDARIGGSPFNVAVGLARLGQPVAFLGSISSGALGERLARALREEGVDLSCIERVDAPTTLSLVGVDARGVPDYAFYGTGGADRRLSMAALDLVPAARRVIQLGSYAMVVEPVATTLCQLVERERARAGVGCLITYDPNVRLNVEPDLDRWRSRLAWMLTRTHLLKISDEDLGLLYPGRPAADFAAQALASGVALVVVTRGGEGAVGFAGSQRVESPPVRVDVIDTVGAGDTFQAALLTWLAERNCFDGAAIRALPREGIAELLRFATQAAAITCSRRGADLPRRSELID
jgi:fructokinase